MAIINIGSMNIDEVYTVEHFVKPGETIQTTSLERHPGGKGLNQSIALARAGLAVTHAGIMGEDAAPTLRKVLTENGVDTQWLREVEGPNGRAIIQVQPDGQNSIFLYGGSNMKFDASYIEEVLAAAQPDDVVLLQNEINDIPHIMEQAKARGLRIVFNAAPATNDVRDYPLHMLDILIINEIEGQVLSDESEPEKIIARLTQKYPDTAIVLTVGADGVHYADKDHNLHVPAEHVSNIVDTTSAGDTFTGYFMSEWLKNSPVKDCLQLACRASAVCIQRAGSSVSVPFRTDIP